VSTATRGGGPSSRPSALGGRGEAPLSATVVGAGFTGIELATELSDMLCATAWENRRSSGEASVHLVDRSASVAPGFGPRARLVIEDALGSLRIETHTGVRVSQLGPEGVTLADGRRTDSAITVWAAARGQVRWPHRSGHRSTPRAGSRSTRPEVSVEEDDFGRILGDVGRRVDGDANPGGVQGDRIVDAVAEEGDIGPASAGQLDDAGLPLGADPGEDRRMGDRGEERVVV
jgi:NADH dehydrogenase FAD-containing subunit